MDDKPTYIELEQRVLELEAAQNSHSQAVRKVRAREARSERQRAAITALALENPAAEINLERQFQKICVLLSEALTVSRASVWTLSGDRSTLRCVNLYETNTKAHSHDAVLYARDFPEYFDAIKVESRFSADDVINDPRTRKLKEHYLDPLGISAMLDSGIVVNGTLLGVVCAEHTGKRRKWHPDEETFVNTMAAFAARCFAECDRKAIGKALEESQQTLDSIIENVHDLIFRLDKEGRITFITGSVRNYGYTPEEMIGTNVLDYVHPEDREKALHRICERRTGSRRTAAYEIRLVPKKFEDRHSAGGADAVQEFPVFLLDAEGLYNSEVTRGEDFIGTQGVARDITDRKRAEEELRKSQALQKAAGRIARVGGWSADLVTQTITWSDEVALIHGKPPGYSPTLGDTWQYVAPEWKDSVLEAYSACMNTGERLEMEFEIITADGSRIWVFTSGEAVHDKSGKIIGIQGALQDIQHRKEMEAEKRELEKRLIQAQKMEAIGRLAGGIAHDFNNVLGVIMGSAELIWNALPADSVFRSRIETIQDAARRSADLTRQLLAFASQQTITPKVIDLNNAVAGILKMLRRLIGEDIALGWVPGAQLHKVKIDPSQIDQVMANLCVNARDAISDVGNITIQTENVSIDSDDCTGKPNFFPGNYVRLSVSDDGCGMDKKTAASIFEPFFTTKAAGKGTGLGMSTVYGIVRQNKGFIDIQSEPDRGTIFQIYLPAEIKAKTVPDSTAPTAPATRGNETVLVVEDEPAILEVVSDMLERLGYTVYTALTPKEALRMAAKQVPKVHLLISDVVMPEMNCRELADNMTAFYPDLKCLFMSGYTAGVIAHHGVLDPNVNFLQKPFSTSELAAQVSGALGQDKLACCA